MNKSILSLILFSLFFNAYGQVQFIERSVIEQSSSVITPKDVLSIDIDGDGDQDIVTASYDDHKIAWYENLDGQGTYGPQKIISINAINAMSVFAIDIDGDGDADVLSASEGNNTIAWYENKNGLGSFSEPKTISNQAMGAKAVMALDMDNDGDIDVISASSEDGKIAWYNNLDGNGNFGAEQLISSSALGVNSIDITDFDGDGYVDILTTSYFPAEIVNGEFIYRVNVEWHKHLDGQGNFGDTILIEKLSYDIPYQGRTADIDNDGDQDIVVGSRDELNWYENTDGLGTFSESIKIVNTRSIPFHITDVNNDGLVDIITYNASSDKLGWHQAKVSGGFTFKEIADIGYTQPEMVNVGDINNDGHSDVLLASSALENITSFKYQPITNDFATKEDVSRNAIWVRKSLLGDVDGDGDLDIVSASGGNKIAWYENIDGQGTFGLQNLITTELQGLSSIDVKDIDGDGDLDIMSIGRWYSGTISPLVWYENMDGLGTFNQEAHLVSLKGDAHYIFGADIDNDNDIDIVSNEDRGTNGQDEILWHENLDGNGDFVAIGAWDAYDKSIANSHSTWDCHPADIDGDGDIDIVYNSYLEEKIAWRENTDGQGTFANEHFIHATKRTYSIVPQDLDGDGDLDLAATTGIIGGKDRIEWYDNTDGQGNFSEPKLITDQLRHPRDITSSDLDGDGDNDLIVADHADNIVGWFENFDGTGNFTNLYELTDVAEGAIHVTTGDINGDNKLDILSSSERDGSILWFQNIGPLNANDPDGDGVLTSQENSDGTDPDDGCSYVEANQNLNTVSIIWEEEDCDNDGALNGIELTNGTDPRNEDTDGDGVLDGDDLNPTDACLPLQNKDYVDYNATNTIWQSFDCDGDEILNGDEVTAGTNPYFNESFYTDSTYPEIFGEQRVEAIGVAMSIATNGTTVAVARRIVSSKVEIYSKNVNGLWEKTQELVSPRTLGSNKFGKALALSDDTLIISQPFDDENLPDEVFIYQKDNNGIWYQTQQIHASSEFLYDGFGTSLSVSENTIVVGADGIAPAGAVYVFEKNGNNTWVETTEIYPSDELYDGAIGYAVSISDNQLVVGASGWGDKGAFIYEKQNDGSWLEVQQLGAPDGENRTYGKDVAIAENRIIIGDIGYTTDVYHQGEAFIYEKSYNGLWRQVQTLEASNGYQEDYFGDALAINNNRIVVNMSANQNDIGWLYVFHKSGGEWIETHVLTDPDYSTLDFGNNVAIAPGLIVATSTDYVHFFEDYSSIGDNDGDGITNDSDSHFDDPCLPVQLAGYTGYDANNAIWANADCDNDGILNGDEFNNNTDPYQANSVEVDCTNITLVGSDAQKSELFGKFMAISKDSSTMAVSSYFDSAKGNYSGAVYIFKKQSDGSWLETQKLTASDGAEGNYFGLSLAFSGNTLVVGSYGRNNSSGAVYIFDVNQNDIWIESQIITPSDLELYVHFGYAVATTEDHIIVGSPTDSQNGVWSGSAYIFKKELDGSWSEVQKIISNDIAIRDSFGISVSISENTAIVGSYQDDDVGENSGSAYVFEKTGNTWAQATKLNASNGLAGDYFSKNVSISNNTIVISSQNGGDSGTAYIYDKSVSGVWQETSRLRSPAGSTDDLFADKILLQDNVLVIGAPSDDENVVGSGSAYIYHKDAATWNLLKKVTLCSPEDYASFGNALALSGTTLALGSNLGPAAGSAHVYEVDIPDPEPLTITIESTEISCNGVNDASITIQAAGGTPPYLYILENPSLGNTSGNRSGQFSNLRAGDYIITVRDDLNVEVVQPISITEAASLNLSTIVEQTCEDSANGSFSIEASGGIPPYQYSIDNGVTFGNSALFTNLPAAEYVTVIQDANGCTFTQLVSVMIDENCSQFTLPANNFAIQTTGESCASNNNGSIIVRAEVNLEYTATLTGDIINEPKNFRTFTNFQDLKAGSYELCITVADQTDYKKCFTISITEPGELDVDSSLDASGKSVSLNLKGGKKYFIDLNGTEYSTSESQITIPLSKIENSITVKTDIECQGVYENTVLAVYNSVSIFPNPVEKGDVTIELPDNVVNGVLITLFSQNGIRVLEKMEKSESRTVKINMDDLPSGVYTIIITTESQNSMRKIIKK